MNVMPTLHSTNDGVLKKIAYCRSGISFFDAFELLAGSRMKKLHTASTIPGGSTTKNAHRQLSALATPKCDKNPAPHAPIPLFAICSPSTYPSADPTGSAV